MTAERATEAERLCRAALRADPISHLAWGALAVTLFNQGRLADVRRILSKIEVDDLDGSTRMQQFMLAVLALACGEPEDGIRLADPWVANSNYSAGLVRALLLVEAGRHAEAQKQFGVCRNLRKDNSVLNSPLSDMFVGVALWSAESGIKMFVSLDDDYIVKAKPVTESDLKTVLDRPALFSLPIADYMLTKKSFFMAARIYESALPARSFHGGNVPFGLLLVHPNRVNAARAAAQVWLGAGTDRRKPSDADRARFLKLAIRWLREEVDENLRSAKKGQSGKANLRLQVLKLHHDLAPIRDPAMIREMPDEERKEVDKIWLDVDSALAKLNPPLDIPGFDKPAIRGSEK